MNLSHLYENRHKLSYFGQCDKVRSLSDENELLWHEMMKNKNPISIDYFIQSVDFSNILDDDETPEEWINNASMSDPDSGTYESNWGIEPVMFFQTAGFEFIFK